MYFETMINMFQKIPVEITKPLSHKDKRQSLLYSIGGGWYMNKFNEKIKYIKKQKLSKKAQENEDEIKRNL